VKKKNSKNKFVGLPSFSWNLIAGNHARHPAIDFDVEESVETFLGFLYLNWVWAVGFVLTMIT
jgi:hypothetical protein